MQKKYSNILLYICLSFFPLLIYYNETLTSPIIDREIVYIDCDDLLKYLKSPVPVLLIDHDILEQIERRSCHLQEDRPVKIGVDMNLKSSQVFLKDPRFHVIFFKNSSKTDFLDFEIFHKRKLIPKNFASRISHNLQVPVDISKFLGFWQRSTFVQCIGNEIENSSTSSEEALHHLMNLKNVLISYGSFPFFNGKTLLKWYKNCAVPEEKMNLAVFSNEFSGKKFLEDLVKEEVGGFKWERNLGKIENSLRIIVTPKNSKIQIEIALMYKDVTDSNQVIYYTGRKNPSFSNYDPWCSTHIHGHQFWLTCTPDKKLEEEFGSNWKTLKIEN